MSAKIIPAIKRQFAKVILGLFTVALVWQGLFLANGIALAAENNSLMLADLGDRVESKLNRDVERTKNFVDDTKRQVKRTANRNEDKVERATDNDNILESKANRDADRIENKANKDAARTKDAIDDTQNIIESTVDKIEDVFSN